MTMTKKMPSSPNYHRVETIAQRLDLSPRSVRRLIDSGKLQAVKIGGAVRVSDDELQRLLAVSRIVCTPDA
jgi:excisionase family DNA binding protein